VVDRCRMCWKDKRPSPFMDLWVCIGCRHIIDQVVGFLDLNGWEVYKRLFDQHPPPADPEGGGVEGEGETVPKSNGKTPRKPIEAPKDPEPVPSPVET